MHSPKLSYSPKANRFSSAQADAVGQTKMSVRPTQSAHPVLIQKQPIAIGRQSETFFSFSIEFRAEQLLQLLLAGWII